MGGGFAYEMELCIPKGPSDHQSASAGGTVPPVLPGLGRGSRCKPAAQPPPSRTAGLLLNPGGYRPHTCDHYVEEVSRWVGGGREKKAKKKKM